jgi:hypothetical protein
MNTVRTMHSLILRNCDSPLYSNLVARTGKSAFLNIVPVPRYGHCNFTEQEVFQAFALMVHQAQAQLIN